MLNMSEGDWKRLIEKIKDGRCTPFIGAGACAGVFPLGAEIAAQWAQEHSYPLEDSRDLARVAQFLAVTEGNVEPKYKIQKQFQKFPTPDFTDPDEPHRVLAGLPFPVYMTTNYDDSMVKALIQQGKDPRQEICHWNSFIQTYEKSIFETLPGFTPTPSNPVVFHLHGNIKVPESIVLTEDDYLDFLIEMSKNQNLLPARIRRAMAGSSLLFLGYRLADWDFRVLFRGIVSNLQIAVRQAHISVQLVPGRDRLTEAQLQEAQKYLIKYFDRSDIPIYWGKCREFVSELRRQWEVFEHGN